MNTTSPSRPICWGQLLCAPRSATRPNLVQNGTSNRILMYLRSTHESVPPRRKSWTGMQDFGWRKQCCCLEWIRRTPRKIHRWHSARSQRRAFPMLLLTCICELCRAFLYTLAMASRCQYCTTHWSAGRQGLLLHPGGGADWSLQIQQRLASPSRRGLGMV